MHVDRVTLERMRDQLKCSLNMGGLRGSAEWAVNELDKMLSADNESSGVHVACNPQWRKRDGSPD